MHSIWLVSPGCQNHFCRVDCECWATFSSDTTHAPYGRSIVPALDRYVYKFAQNQSGCHCCMHGPAASVRQHFAYKLWMIRLAETKVSTVHRVRAKRIDECFHKSGVAMNRPLRRHAVKSTDSWLRGMYCVNIRVPSSQYLAFGRMAVNLRRMQCLARARPVFADATVARPTVPLLPAPGSAPLVRW